MKKLFLLAVATIIGFGAVMAKPVNVNTAKALGQKFVQANFEQSFGADLQLVYTFNDQRGEASMYVFDVDDNGFVIVSADDHFRPIVGYSKEDTFHPESISPEFTYFMNSIISGRDQSKGSDVDPNVATEWRSLEDYGRLMSFNGGRGVDFLVQTRWDQSPAPYNSMCPADANSPGGHAYVGCVATAMSQLMKYWNYPTQGQGSNSYVCLPGPGYAGHPEYGTQTANFGATTYQWDQMLNTYSSGNYSPEQGNAVATICYHCGVSVNMMYGNNADNGSGAYTDDVPAAIQNYFLYTSAAYVQNYNGNLTWWKGLLKEQFDLGWPVYYAGVDPDPQTGGGHAFICDGYDDADMYHFNWGWGGYQDAFYDINEIDYSNTMRLVLNFVPAPVYNSTPNAPTNLTVTKASDVAQEATLTWTNPTKTMSNQNLSTIDRIVVKRNNIVIYTEDNVAPGANMTFVDHNVPCYSTFEYRVYAVKDDCNGKAAAASESFGPTCEWRIVATAGAMQGWKGGQLIAYDGAGREITSVTMTSNNPANIPINLTLGRVSFAWKTGTDVVTLSFKIKDASGAVVYEFPTNTSDNIPAGFFYTGNNGCGNTPPTGVPGELFATRDGDNVILTWNDAAKTDYGINIYRDGFLCGLSQTNEFVDLQPGLGGHCYHICYLNDGGESSFSNEACASVGEGCDPGTNLWIGFKPNGNPLITWDMPEVTDGLSGFYIYRKINDGEYTQIKVLGANKHEYTDSTVDEEGWYYYKVKAYYKSIECYSAPFKAQFGNEYFVKIYYSVTDVNDAMAGKVSVYPNPVKDNFTVEAEGLQRVMVYNTLGQMVYNQPCEGDAVMINLGNVESGFYMVKVLCNEGETVRKISVIR